MFAVDIAFVCFYHAERILPLVVNKDVHSVGDSLVSVDLLGEEEALGEMGEGREEETGMRTKRLRRCGKWECTKNNPKTQQIWHLGTPLGS